MIIQGIYTPISLYFLQQILNAVQDKKDIVWNYLAIYFVLAIVNILFERVYNLYSIKITKKFEKRIDILILEKTNSLNLSDYENLETYNIINRAQSQGGESIISYIKGWFDILKSFITVISSFMMLSFFKTWILIIILITPILEYYFSMIIINEQYNVSISRTEKERKKWYLKYIMSMGNAFKEMKIYNLGEKFLDEFNKISEFIINQDFKIQNKNFKYMLGTDFLDQFNSLIIYCYIIKLGIAGTLKIGDITAYIRCIENIKDSISLFFFSLNTNSKLSLNINLIYEFLDLHNDKLEILNNERNITIEEIRNIKLVDVSYKYKENHTFSIENINLEIQKGDIIGIVGRNGSGKSTLMKIILGFYTDYEGEIYINGINFKNIDRESYFKNISAVFQDFMKYETSIRENISYGNLKKINNTKEIELILKKVGLENLLQRGDGVDSIIGNWFGEGEVSGGEWQKLSIARALIKDSDLVALDEPDSSLDVCSENDMLNTYKKLFEEKIGLIITHKISSIENLTNKIIVLKNGKIVEVGNKEDLMNINGEYKNLINAELNIRGEII